MNLAQSPIPSPAAPINFSLPDLSKWDKPEPQKSFEQVMREDTLRQVKALLKEHGQMDMLAIRDALDNDSPTLRTWMHRWWLAREFEKKALRGRLVYQLGKGSE